MPQNTNNSVTKMKRFNGKIAKLWEKKKTENGKQKIDSSNIEENNKHKTHL